MNRVLIVNKFLFPNGGSETYIFRLGEQLTKMGHEVQYFGMADERNVVGNHIESYTSNMNFHTRKLSKLVYPFKIIYSVEARRAIRKVLEDFKPNVVHLNNFNFQITPSIIYEIRKYEKQTGNRIKILFTAHDSQLVCPNRLMHRPLTDDNCDRCIDGKYMNCVKGKCIHSSTLKSVLGAMEGYIYRYLKTYKQIDVIICPSRFIQEKLERNISLKGRTVWLQNFVTIARPNELVNDIVAKPYILYFGRYTKDKGVESLLQVCQQLPEISFLFAGGGPLEDEVNRVNNIENKGFLDATQLRLLIEQARFTIHPSEHYENCPFSVIESIQYGTPALGSDIGGIPELINEGVTGELFQSGSKQQLKEKISKLWNDDKQIKKYQEACMKKEFISLEQYCEALLEVYKS